MLRPATARDLVAALALLPLGASGQVVPSFDPVRLAADVQAYYDLGVHRTAHPGDLATSAWLFGRLRGLGLEVEQQEFALRQFFLEEASIADARGSIEAFPIWLPRATGAEGVTGPLVWVDASTPAGALRGAVAWLESASAQLDRKALDAGAAAVVFATSDGAGLGLLQAVNAERTYVSLERPVPTVVFGTAASERLRQAVGQEVTVRVTGRMVDDAKATNVLARHVVDERADWIVVSTPSSGWFTNGGERGPGIAVLLALAEWVASRDEGLNYLFVTTSGHELDYLGARLLHEAQRAPSPERTRAWLHLGAQIATPPWRSEDGVLRPATEVTTGTLQASEELAPFMRDAFADLPAFRLRTDTRIGEFRDLVDHGYRGLGVVGGSNPWFHVEGDDPRSVSDATLALVAEALARALLEVERFRA